MRGVRDGDVPGVSRRCSTCGMVLAEGHFLTYRKRNGDFGLMRTCNDCRTAKALAWNKANPERFKANIRKSQKKTLRRRRAAKYALTETELAVMEAASNGLCSICLSPFEGEGQGRGAHIDHDHKTGQVRGLLCPQCNVGLGSFKDRPELLIRAAIYLKRGPLWES